MTTPPPSESGAPPEPWAPPLAGPVPSPRPRTSVRAADERPRPVPVALRPVSVMEIIDGGFDILKARPGLLLGVSAMVVVPVDLVGAWLNREQLQEGIGGVFNSSLPGSADSASSDIGTLWSLIAPSVAVAVVGAVLARVVRDWFAETDVSVGPALSWTVRRLPALFVVWLLVHLAEAAGLLACGLGSIFFMVRLSVSAPAYAIENLSPLAAVKRSWGLTDGRFGPVLGLCLLVAVVTSVVEFALTAIPLAVAEAVDADYGWVAAQAVSIAVSVLSTALVGATAVVQYVDLRSRRDGFDLEMRAIEVFGERRHRTGRTRT